MTHSTLGASRVQLAQGQDLERIGQFRYQVYVKELGRRAAFADHGRQTLIEPADHLPHSVIFYTEHQGQLTGTARATLGPLDEDDIAPYAAVTDAPALQALPAAKMVLVTRLMVAPNARGLGDAAALVQACFEFSCRNGVVLGLASCKPALQPFFQRSGFAVCGPDYEHPDAGAQRPMLMVVEPAFLAARRSRLAALCGHHRTHSPWSPIVEGIFNERITPAMPAIAGRARRQATHAHAMGTPHTQQETTCLQA